MKTGGNGAKYITKLLAAVLTPNAIVTLMV